MTWSLEYHEFSLAYIVLTKWIPPLITILVGGLFASILIPRWQDRTARRLARQERKLSLAETFARNATRYTTAWGRLRAISELEAKKGVLTSTELERKKGYVHARTVARDELLDTARSLEVYLPSGPRTILEGYISWDEENSRKSLNELPGHKEFVRQQDAIIQHLYEEVRN